MNGAKEYAATRFGAYILDVPGEWVVTNIIHQAPRVTGLHTVAVGPTSYATAAGHAAAWNAEPDRSTTWIIRQATPEDFPD